MKILTRFLCFIMLALFSYCVSAQTKPILYTSITPDAPSAPAYLFNSHNSVGHGIGINNSKQLRPPIFLQYDPVEWTQENRNRMMTTQQIDCNLAAMLALPNSAAIVNYAKTHSYSCMSFLWDYSPDMKRLYTKENLTAVMNEIGNLAPQYNGTNASHLIELMFFVRAAYYHDFWSPFDGIRELRPILSNSLRKLFSSPSINNNTIAAAEVLDMAINTYDAAETYDLLPYIESTLNVMLADLPARISVWEQRQIIDSSFFTLQRSANNGRLSSVPNSLIDTLKKYSLLTLATNYEWIINNAIWALGKFAADVPGAKTNAMLALEAAYNFHAKWTIPWYWSIRAMALTGNCFTMSNGQRICLSTVRDELKQRLFPNNFVFDNGALVINTPLDTHEVEPIYHATKEVTAQFGRVIKHLNPVANDPNATLKVYLYGTLSDYSNYHTFLFNTSSDNGGIYIEQNGTFYTYQRTTRESIYTLQELTRHEYSHYLIGRYLVEGMWGEVPIYNNDRMVFFDEGMAEFYAGSVPRDDIAQRVSLVNQIKNDGKANRLNIATIVTANYDTPRFYRYSGLFFHFLYKKHLDILNNFNSILRASNVSGFDALTTQLRNNSALNTEYQSYLDEAVLNVGNLTTPTTRAPIDIELFYHEPIQIQNILSKISNFSDISCSLIYNQSNQVFNCKGKVKGTSLPSNNMLSGWYGVNQSLNEALRSTIKTKRATNLNWMNCRFEEISWINNGNNTYTPTSTFSCDGPIGQPYL